MLMARFLNRIIFIQRQTAGMHKCGEHNKAAIMKREGGKTITSYVVHAYECHCRCTHDAAARMVFLHATRVFLSCELLVGSFTPQLHNNDTLGCVANESIDCFLLCCLSLSGIRGSLSQYSNRFCVLRAHCDTSS